MRLSHTRVRSYFIVHSGRLHADVHMPLSRKMFKKNKKQPWWTFTLPPHAILLGWCNVQRRWTHLLHMRIRQNFRVVKQATREIPTQKLNKLIFWLATKITQALWFTIARKEPAAECIIHAVCLYFSVYDSLPCTHAVSMQMCTCPCPAKYPKKKEQTKSERCNTDFRDGPWRCDRCAAWLVQ